MGELRVVCAVLIDCLLAMKRVAVFFLALALAFAPVAWAEEIPLERVKSAEGLPEGTRSLLKGMASFQLNAVEEKLLAEKPGAGDAMIEICELVQEVEHLSQAFMALRNRTEIWAGS